tara:strand:- start:5 stop:214 length:210 start_codon:yes stop_codon:yes gene_type:complete
MSVEFYVLVIPFCIIPVFLVSLDYLNRNAAHERRNHNVVDFGMYIKHKEKGDAVDIAIAELIDIDQIVA